ncbi:phage major capsid protein [Paenibacillus macerans]|uniref:phage major capsid protein n=1 Tax=Paenibacillus macerans TaxID=44252 RepID=UPI003D314864
MTKELRALLDQLEAGKKEVRSLMIEDKVDEAEKRMKDVRELQKKVDLQRELEGDELRDSNGTPIDSNQPRDMIELESEYRSIFLMALRRQPVSTEQRSVALEYAKRAVLGEGGVNPSTPSGDASLIVPKDIQTSINKVEREIMDLSMYVNMQYVTALSGTRVLESVQDITPFDAIEEYGLFGDMKEPNFIPVSYSVKKYGGILPLTNELLGDTDQNLIDYLSGWIGNKAVFTRNMLIINRLNAMQKVQWDSFKDVKKALNVGLDPAISQNASILTNQDGYDWMDEQTDSTGRPLLTDDLTQPGRKVFKGRPILVASNRILPSDNVNGLAPMVVGNLKQLIACFCRKFYELASTKEGGNAFLRDTTDLRAITRCDVKSWDEAAAVFGQLDISDTI